MNMNKIPDKAQIVKKISRSDLQRPVQDPFLFCAHHLDFYPAGNEKLGPGTDFNGRNPGNDFQALHGWRMYHGLTVPGFPVHPHRGFETITITLQGFVDHFDSAGGAGRYGNGDVQWMTAGSGLQHVEMFPLIDPNGPNTLELFQIWLNLPASRKMVNPYYRMHWAEDIPVLRSGESGKQTEVRLIVGSLEGTRALPPAPDSWAADPVNEVAVYLIRMDPGTSFFLPPVSEKTGRRLFLFRGDNVSLAELNLVKDEGAELLTNAEMELRNGSNESHILFLQGRAIDEPVFQYGPFVMNSGEEIRQAFDEYRRTNFGGWPWPTDDPVHPASTGRFAQYSDGRKEFPLQNQ